VPLELPPTQLPAKAATESLRRNLSLREALGVAIDEERNSREFYLEAANQVQDLTGKEMLRFLSDMEFSHEMALTAEYELHVKYPNYFEGVAEPWEEERGLRKEKI
jgi:rubrerythrin